MHVECSAAAVILVEVKEIANIEGFDEETAGELQARARDYLAQVEAEYDAKRQELGVADEVKEVPGVTTRMLVAFGENDVKTVEDLAGCATDDLIGWNETVNGERKHQTGILEGFDIGADEANTLIMRARVKAGWITDEDMSKIGLSADHDVDNPVPADEFEQDSQA